MIIPNTARPRKMRARDAMDLHPVRGYGDVLTLSLTFDGGIVLWAALWMS